MGRAQSMVFARAAAALKIEERLPVDEWADRYRKLAVGTSEHHGRWLTDRAPYQREIMRAWSDPAVRQVTFMKGSQVGGTEVLINILQWTIDQDPGPTLLIYPSLDLAKDVNEERIRPAMMATERILKRLRSGAKEPGQGGRMTDLKALKLQFDRMTVWGVGSNSQTNLESRPVKNLLVDELDAGEFHESAMSWARQRQKSFRRRKTLVNSKPSLEGHGVHREFLEGSQERYHVPCPHCGEYQVLRWKQLRWEGSLRADPEVVQRTACYHCEKCDRVIPDAAKPAMLLRGVWAREGTSVRRDGTIEGRPENETREHRSFQLSSLYAPKLSFGYVAAEFVRGGGATRQWVNGELGEPYVQIGEHVKEDKALSVCVPASMGGYRLCLPNGAGTAESVPRLVPKDVLVLVAAVDVQRDRVYAEVRGFTEGMRESYLIWRAERVKAVGLAGLRSAAEDIAAMRFVHAYDGRPVRVAAGCIDSGDPESTLEVYQLVSELRQKALGKWYASKGSGQMNGSEPHKIEEYDPRETFKGKARAGVLVPEKVPFFVINTYLWKARVLSDLRAAIREVCGDSDGVELVEPGRMYLPEIEKDDELGVGEYVRQLTAEELFTETIRGGNRAGFTKRVWKLRPGRQDNHHFDTAVACYALCDALNGRSITRQRFEQSRAAIKNEPAASTASARTQRTGVDHEQSTTQQALGQQRRQHQSGGETRPRIVFGPGGRFAGGDSEDRGD